MSKTTNRWCPVCLMPTYIEGNAARTAFKYECARCGEYTATGLPDNPFDFSATEIANASGYIRANQGFLLSGSEEIEFLRALTTPTVAQKAERLLRALAKQYPAPGAVIEIPYGIDKWVKDHTATIQNRILKPIEVSLIAARKKVRMLSYGWVQTEDELNYLLFDYLAESASLLTGQPQKLVPGGIEQAQVSISPAGWEFIEAGSSNDGNTGFVAMWFDPKLNNAFNEAIYPAIEAAGYVPLRIDQKQHNNRIDDEIIAAIRGCRFLVADFTGSRGGVYYEAGFAGGLGKPVIWTVREDHLKDVHFDTRQYNHIVWNQEELEEFRVALKNRIVATIGSGPNV